MVITVISAIIQYLSFKPKYGVEFCYYSILIQVARVALRMMDFENTKNNQDKHSWNKILLINAVGNTAYIVMLSLMFANKKYNK